MKAVPADAQKTLHSVGTCPGMGIGTCDICGIAGFGIIIMGPRLSAFFHTSSRAAGSQRQTQKIACGCTLAMTSYLFFAFVSNLLVASAEIICKFI